MATYHMQNYYRPSPLTVETQPKYFEEDEGSILDDNILERSTLDSGLEMSPPMDSSRRESFAVSSTLFSPKQEDWQQQDLPTTSASHNPFVVEHSNNPFMRLDPAQAAAYGHQAQAWGMNSSSGTCTPMGQYDGLPGEFDSNSLAYRPMHGQTPFSNSANSVSMFAVNSQQSMPASPQKEWMQTDGIDQRAVPKRMRGGSPLRSHSPLLRRDGIRKKNARFDIPAERNLMNIDQLISQSTDEQEIKELKQQKRLLRNRQAALDSRQRKKQHTERLEDEKKQYTALISELEEELADTKISLDELARKEQQYQQYIEGLQMEKEELVRNHTIETGDLRKKVSVLSEHIQKLESTAMSTVPSSTGFTADYSDIDTLTMDSAWDNVSFLNDFNAEDKEDHPLVPAKKDIISEKDKPAGLLLMLLLVGAFVASKGVSPRVPKMSDDVRAASATLLEDIFKDAGVSQVATDSMTGVVGSIAPLPSGSWSSGNSVAPSMLGDLTDSLAHPTEEQNNESLFSLSAAQYEGVTSQDFLRNTPQPSTSEGRRNLGETLAAMRSSSKQSAAEVYTRSLLWDQVPKEVVRNFAKLVSECNTGGTQEANDPVAG